MKDLVGFILLALSLLGAIKGRNLPELIPLILTVVSISMLTYKLITVRFKLSFVYTGAAWASAVWYMGILLRKAEVSAFVLVPYFLLLFLTPAVMFLHQRIYRRFNPAPVRGLDIEQTETAPDTAGRVRGFLEKIKLKKGGEDKTIRNETERLEPITFDLGREVEYKNR